MTTRADKRGDRYVLNGGKHWITGGGVSRLHLIFARVFDNGVEQGIGGFIALRDPEAGTPKGLRIGKREPTMGLRGIPETEVLFEDLEIGEDWLLQPLPGMRHGFGALLSAFTPQRDAAATLALRIHSGDHSQASHQRHP